jgi:hypothetical protein
MSGKDGSKARRRAWVALAVLLVVGASAGLWLTRRTRTPARVFRFSEDFPDMARWRSVGLFEWIPEQGACYLELLGNETPWLRPVVNVRVHCHPDEQRELSVLVDGELIQRHSAAPVVNLRIPGTLTGQQECVVQLGPPEEKQIIRFTHTGPLHVDLREIGDRLRNLLR